MTEPKRSLILDGQQRLATATILLSVLRDTRRHLDAHAATRLQTRYIADVDDKTNQIIPVLTMNEYDRDFFRQEVQEEGKPPPKAQYQSHALIRRAREYFAKQIEDEYAKTKTLKDAYNRNVRLADVLREHMSLVVIESDDEDSASGVFETLNDRGIGLSTPDLLRNLLMRRTKDKERQRTIVKAWQAVISIEDECSVDEFLRHYWVSRNGDVKSRKLYREIKDWIVHNDVDAVEFSQNLAAEAPVYREFAGGRDSDATVQRSLAGVKMMGAKSLLPALLSGQAALADSDDRKDLQRLAHALVALFVRHSVIGARESTLLEARVFNVAAKLRRDKDFDEAIESLADLAPSAADFVLGFSHASVKRIATVRYLLRELESALRETGEVDVAMSDRVHVEHIYPQTPDPDLRWDSHSQMINRLGNLTLLSKRFNTSIKNSSFEVKKEKGYKSSDLLLTKQLLSYSCWTPDTIAERQMDLAKLAPRIWAFSGEPQLSDSEIDEIADLTGISSPQQQSIDELPEVPE